MLDEQLIQSVKISEGKNIDGLFFPEVYEFFLPDTFFKYLLAWLN